MLKTNPAMNSTAVVPDPSSMHMPPAGAMGMYDPVHSGPMPFSAGVRGIPEPIMYPGAHLPPFAIPPGHPAPLGVHNGSMHPQYPMAAPPHAGGGVPGGPGLEQSALTQVSRSGTPQSQIPRSQTPQAPRSQTPLSGDSAAASSPGPHPQVMSSQTSQSQQAVILGDLEEDSLQQQQLALANTKEKTPMCLINELARYNKILHQYTLIDEQGPAHKKTFYVKLKLGEEEYEASGPSIKKAQHMAASNALNITAFKHPPPKPPKTPELDAASGTTVTPTVELNALAMKRNEPAVYKPIENRQPSFYPPAGFDFRTMAYNQSIVDPGGKVQVSQLWYHYPRVPRTFYVSLKVGTREFIGEGSTRQAARHNAAAKALRVIKSLPMPEGPAQKEEVKVETEDEEKDKLKSEISLVHEIALKRNLPVNFEVVRESGPPHMKMFVTHCSVGDLMTEAEGNSKKVSKKKAAEMMLEELRQMPPLSATIQRPKTKQPVNKKKNRNLIKVQKADLNYGVGINPISRLIQIMQAQKKKEPIYTFKEERGLPRRREFVIQVEVDDNTCTGTGPNKKLAKRNAAEAMLQLLGYSKPSPQPAKSAIKTTPSPDGGSGDKKVTFLDSSMENGSSEKPKMPKAKENKEGIKKLKIPKAKESIEGAGGGGGNNSGKAGRQIAPGLLLLDNNALPNYQKDAASSSRLNPQAESLVKEAAKKNNIEVMLEDFTGQNGSYLCQVALKTVPQHVKSGRGRSAQEARLVAANEALNLLSELGLLPSQEGVDFSGDWKPVAAPDSGSTDKTERKV